MKKRGDTYTLYVIAELVIAIFIVISSIVIITAWASNQAFDKVQLAKDIALQANALYTVPGNMYIVNDNHRNFSALFSDGLVNIYKKEKEDTTGQYYYVGLKKKYFEKNLYKPPIIVLTKNGDTIGATDELETLNKLNYPTISTLDEDWKDKYKIFIDPGHGDSADKRDPGIENNNLNLKKESAVTLAIAESLRALNLNIQLTRDFETYVSIDERKNILKEADVIISVHIGEYSNDKNSVKAYIPLESNKNLENKKLATIILNSLTKELDLDTISIIPVDTKNIAAESPEAILQFEDKIVILLEIGNVNSDKGIEMLNKLVPIPNLINQGIIEYFEVK